MIKNAHIKFGTQLYLICLYQKITPKRLLWPRSKVRCSAFNSWYHSFPFIKSSGNWVSLAMFNLQIFLFTIRSSEHVIKQVHWKSNIYTLSEKNCMAKRNFAKTYLNNGIWMMLFSVFNLIFFVDIAAHVVVHDIDPSSTVKLVLWPLSYQLVCPIFSTTITENTIHISLGILSLSIWTRRAFYLHKPSRIGLCTYAARPRPWPLWIDWALRVLGLVNSTTSSSLNSVQSSLNHNPFAQ